MEIRFDEAAIQKIEARLAPDKKLLLTYEDSIGPYSQHGEIHMQVQFSLNIVPEADPAIDYDSEISSNLGPVLQKGYAAMYLDPHMVIHFDGTQNRFSLVGDGGEIDDNMGFIDFTDPDGKRLNQAR